MTNVLIPNGTSPQNIGDLAMITVLKRLIERAIPRARITIHSTEPHLHTSLGVAAKNTLYSYVAFVSRNPLVRSLRLIRMLGYYFVFWFRLDRLVAPLVLSDPLFNLCLDYQKADYIVFVGGGYLRTKPGISQSLNLVMQLFMIGFAKLFANVKIIAPISFGPFAYRWQERLAAAAVNGVNVISAREEISYQKMRQNKIENVILSVDHALLLGTHRAQVLPRSKILGYTLRRWFGDREQIQFESEVAAAICQFALKRGYSVQPILQVDAPLYGDDDRLVTERVRSRLERLGVGVRPLLKVTDLAFASDVYLAIDILLGMRMHSNVLAAIVATPYVAISYEHKTEGISRSLGMADFCLQAQQVRASRLVRLLEKLDDNWIACRQKLIAVVAKLRSKEESRWTNIFSEN